MGKITNTKIKANQLSILLELSTVMKKHNVGTDKVSDDSVVALDAKQESHPF